MNPITVNMDFAELKKNFLDGKEIDLVLFLRGIENMNERFNYIPELVEFIFESISLIKYSEYQEKQKSLLVELKVKFINQAFDIKGYDKTE